MIDLFSISDLDKEFLASIQADSKDLVDDHFDYSKVIVRKPWGYEYLIFQNESVAVWILYLKKDAQTSMHCHPNKKTSLIVLKGEVECSSASRTLRRKVAEGLLIDKAVFHQTRTVSEQGAFIMEIETPVNKRDLMRLKDLYGREGQGYENADQHSTNIQNYNYLSLGESAPTMCPKKRFGDCSITFKGLPPGDPFTHLSEFADDDVISVIRGAVHSDKNEVLYTVGDTKTIKDLKLHSTLRCAANTEVLIVRRVDTDVKISDYIADFLKNQGMKSAFVVPGDANVHLLDSLGREEGVHCIPFQSEAGASLSVEGYSKVTQKLETLIISSGGSGPHALPGICNAWVDSTPLLVISGQARSDQLQQDDVRQLGNKSLNIIEIVSSVTKYAVQITDPLSIKYHLSKAIHLATTGRQGPVWLDIPIDILGTTVDAKDMVEYVPETPQRDTKLKEDVRKVIARLSAAQRPVILAGHGIRLSHGVELFLSLAQKLQIPVLTSRRGADLIPEDHPLFIGRPGTFGQRRANFALQNSDCILNIGSRLSIPLIGRDTKAFGRAAYKISVDIDPAELSKKSICVDLPIQSSADAFMQCLLDEVSTLPTYDHWWAQCKQWKKDFPPLGETYEHREFINPYLFLNEVSRQFNKGEIIVMDGGPIMHCATQIFEFGSSQRLIASTGLELPGFAIPASVGAAIANPGRRVLCFCEDRGFQKGIPELQTIIDNQLPITIFILKSRGFSSVRNIQKDFFGRRYVGTDNEILFGSPQFLNIGTAYGFTAIEIKESADLPARISSALSSTGPTICSIEVDSEQGLSPRMGFVVKEDGKWIPKPLEDMYPFLDRAVLRKNMLIDLQEES